MPAQNPGAVGDFMPVTTAPVDLYIDIATGNDANPGTQASPKQTILGGLDALPEGIAHPATLHVRPGNYPEGNATITFSRFTMLTWIYIKAVNDNDEDMYDNGQADAGAGNNELDDATKSWSTDQFNGAYVWIYSGTGAGQIREISDTTATKLTLTSNWTTNPDGTSYYAIGGGVTLNGTGSGHFQVAGYKQVGIYGFKHTGATNTSLYWMTWSNGRCYNNYIADVDAGGLGGVMIQSMSDVIAYYNYVDISGGGGTKYGLRSIQGSAWYRANVVMGDDSASSYGMSIERTGLNQSVTNANYLNYIQDCSTGIRVKEGSGFMALGSQVVSSCATPTDVDATSWST